MLQVTQQCRSKWPLGPHNESLGSWLFVRRDSNKKQVGFSCKACYLSQDSDTDCVWSKLATQKLAAHANSRRHKLAVLELTKCPTCKIEVEKMLETSSAPSYANFQKLWKDRGAGISMRAAEARGACATKRHKFARLQWCLAESVREQQRAQLRQCRVCVSHSDAKAHRFTMRFSAATMDTMENFRGTFGHVTYKKHGDAADSYVTTTDRVLINFCTRWLGAPRSQKQPIFDKALFQHLQNPCIVGQRCSKGHVAHGHGSFQSLRR